MICDRCSSSFEPWVPEDLTPGFGHPPMCYRCAMETMDSSGEQYYASLPDWFVEWQARPDGEWRRSTDLGWWYPTRDAALADLARFRAALPTRSSVGRYRIQRRS